MYNDFVIANAGLDRYCDYKRLNFAAPGGVDYSNINTQRLYYLRYYPAYLAEYWMMYGVMRNMVGECFAPNILSVGCGGGVDYAAASLAFQGGMPVGYRGVDLCSWSYVDFYPIENSDILEYDISSDTNVLFFPKSLGDLAGVVNGLSEKLREKVWNSNVVCIAASFRNSYAHLQTDVNNFMLLARSISGFDYSPELDRCFNGAQYVEGGNPPGITNYIVGGFAYPGDIMRDLASLRSGCPTMLAAQMFCEGDCCQSLERQLPMLKISNFNFRVIVLRRNA